MPAHTRVSYSALCFTLKTKEIGNVCVQANMIHGNPQWDRKVLNHFLSFHFSTEVAPRRYATDAFFEDEADKAMNPPPKNNCTCAEGDEKCEDCVFSCTLFDDDADCSSCCNSEPKDEATNPPPKNNCACAEDDEKCGDCVFACTLFDDDADCSSCCNSEPKDALAN